MWPLSLELLRLHIILNATLFIVAFTYQTSSGGLIFGCIFSRNRTKTKLFACNEAKKEVGKAPFYRTFRLLLYFCCIVAFTLKILRVICKKIYRTISKKRMKKLPREAVFCLHFYQGLMIPCTSSESTLSLSTSTTPVSMFFSATEPPFASSRAVFTPS